MNHEPKRLYRSDNAVFAGVCGGIGEFFGIDPVAVRLLWVLVSVFTGFVPGLIAYVLAALIMPPQHPHVV